MSVFPLIWMGGLVTSKGAGMSVPDWPNSYGYNMFLFPPGQWIGGIFYEHTHRLLGTLSGLLSILLVFLAWGPSRRAGVRYGLGVFTVSMLVLLAVSIGLQAFLANASQMTGDLKSGVSHLAVLFGALSLLSGMAWCCRRREPRSWVRWLTIGQLLLIIVQGYIGGQRVTRVNIELAMVHACLAQCFFCLAAFTALATSRWWQSASCLQFSADAPAARRATLLCSITLVAIFIQLIAGALMRHNQAGLAIPDLPLAFGKVLPPMDQPGLDAANQLRNWDYHLNGQMTFAQVWMHFAHRIGAVFVTFSVVMLAITIIRNLRQHRAIFRLAVILLGLVTLQFCLGVLTVWLQKPADIASLHVAVGAVTFMTATQVLAVTARQFASLKHVSEPADLKKDAAARGWVTV